MLARCLCTIGEGRWVPDSAIYLAQAANGPAGNRSLCGLCAGWGRYRVVRDDLCAPDGHAEGQNADAAVSPGPSLRSPSEMLSVGRLSTSIPRDCIRPHTLASLRNVEGGPCPGACPSPVFANPTTTAIMAFGYRGATPIPCLLFLCLSVCLIAGLCMRPAPYWLILPMTHPIPCSHAGQPTTAVYSDLALLSRGSIRGLMDGIAPVSTQTTQPEGAREMRARGEERARRQRHRCRCVCKHQHNVWCAQCMGVYRGGGGGGGGGGHASVACDSTSLISTSKLTCSPHSLQTCPGGVPGLYRRGHLPWNERELEAGARCQG